MCCIRLCVSQVGTKNPNIYELLLRPDIVSWIDLSSYFWISASLEKCFLRIIRAGIYKYNKVREFCMTASSLSSVLNVCMAGINATLATSNFIIFA